MDKDPILLRLFYAVGFFVVYRLLDIVVVIIAIVQFAHQLFIGEPHADLVVFGRNLAAYIAQIANYLFWSSDEKPFPFSDWPSVSSVSSEESH